MLEIFLAMPNLPENGSVYRRTASRGVVVQDGRLLMIHTAAGDYKFPGGGVEPGETLQEALCREMLEETGRSVTGGIEPAVRTGGIEPTVRTGGIEPTVRTGGIEPAVRTGGIEPTVRTGGIEPTVRTGGIEPTVRTGGIEPAVRTGG